jgi:hypothetical protein
MLRHRVTPAPDLLADQPSRPSPRAANSAIRHFSNSDNRSAITHLPIDPTRSKDVMR